jgi:alanyl-tRNA synthetase
VDAGSFRSDFLEFFREKGHRIVPSASLMPSAPNLLFTNAGMNQFVPCFLGQRPNSDGRVADVQKCIRAGGKHNDLEDVGYDCYHHTFFEMLGNWSFGDYFKEEAIRWAWELLVKRWHFPKERLMATVYRPLPGDPASYDGESYAIWCRLFREEGLDPERHISYGGARDNFWMMGETGPCGPCTEIHMDLTARGDGGLASVGGSSPRRMELWNLVFIQYNALGDEKFEQLPQRYVDTGMGLERIAGIWATTDGFRDFSRPPSNYSSSLFQPLLDRVARLSGKDITYGGSVPENRRSPSERELFDCAFRAVADHSRTLTLAIADGIFPSNEGRGYVLRRILRRAVLFGRRLELRGNYLADLADVCRRTLETAYGNLSDSREVIQTTLIREQDAFERTIDRGLQVLEAAIGIHRDRIPGEVLFELHDTYGFPLDLSQLIAAERNCSVDLEGFERAMERQRTRARSSQKMQKITVEASALPPTVFVGYDLPDGPTESTILAVLPRSTGGSCLVTAESPFYGEMGGQCGDRGAVTVDGKKWAIVATERGGKGTLLHAVNGSLDEKLVGQRATLEVDKSRRRRICAHHTATHILQAALRKRLGNHVMQAGSLVTEDCLRFDFSHFRALSEEELAEVEREANGTVRANMPVNVFETEFEKRPPHCLAHFGERYGGRVRVVEIGPTAELCGGTHASATGEIGTIKIIAESAIAAGTRRICALAGEVAHEHYGELFRRQRELQRELAGGEPLEAIRVLRERLKNFEKEAKERTEAARREELAGLSAALRAAERHRHCHRVRPQDGEALRALARQLQAQLEGSDLLLLLAEERDRWNFAIVGGPDGGTAGELAKELATAVGGRGGGRGNFAGGTLPRTDDRALTGWIRKFQGDDSEQLS